MTIILSKNNVSCMHLTNSLKTVPGYGDYFIGFLDILGFRNIVKSGFDSNDGRLYDMTHRVFEDLPNYYLTGMSDYYGPYAIPEAERPEQPDHRYVKEIINSSFFFSDTILFCIRKAKSDEKRIAQFAYLCRIMSEYIRLLLLSDPSNRTIQAPLRGAIASGPAIVDKKKKLFFGPSIIDAYELAEAQNWAGAAIHPSVNIDEMFEGDASQVVGFDNLLYEYGSIPLDKNRDKYQNNVRYALNWVMGHKAGIAWFPEIKKRKPLARDVVHHLGKINWEGRLEKRNNTMLFAATICDDYSNSKHYFDDYSKGGPLYKDGSLNLEELLKELKKPGYTGTSGG